MESRSHIYKATCSDKALLSPDDDKGDKIDNLSQFQNRFNINAFTKI